MATSTGIPAQSDRSAWDADNYPEKHAIDLYNSVPKHHLPLGSGAGNYPRWDGSKWVAQALTVSDLALVNTHIFVGNVSNDATDVAMSGDATIDNAGTLMLKNTGPGATGPIGDGTNVPVITIDAQGRVTALTSAAITGSSGLTVSDIIEIQTFGG